MTAIDAIQISDKVLERPEEYRAAALGGNFRSYDFGHCVFHGISVDAPRDGLLNYIRDMRPDLAPTLSFFRKSPLGQVEPHFIHTDIDMGDWSAILYLNPEAPSGDGTDFWTHRETGEIENFVPHERSEDGRDTKKWILREHVEGYFNRLLMFPSSYFHSRAIFENWGTDGRLIQVVFGKGAL